MLTQALEESKYDALIDPRLQNDYNYQEMTRMVACAAVCVRYLARLRPRMSQVLVLNQLSTLEGLFCLQALSIG